MAQTTQAFTDLFGKFGFAFARVEARPEVDRSNNRVVMVLQAEPSRRAYVRRIMVAGNNRTRDEVIRRELRQLEASWYDGDKIKLSRDRLNRLGYFMEVNVETQEVPGTLDQVDLLISVTEKPTGSISLGAGFSSYEKVALMFGITQENAFGSGNFLALQVNTSRYNRNIVLSTTDPYYTDTGISRTLDVFHRTSRPYFGDLNAYQIVTSGLGMRFGLPVTERDTVFVGANLEQSGVRAGNGLPNIYQPLVEQGDRTSVPLTLGWSRDGRDSALVPTRGNFQRFFTDWSVAGDSRYVRTNYQFQQYVPLTKKYTFAFNTDLGWGKGLNGQDFPLLKNFYVGGLGSVRGYQQSTLGYNEVANPPTNTNLVYTGGAKKVVFNLEMIGPFPGVGNDKTLRVFGFLDAGYAFRDQDQVRLNELRSSYGVGLSWISPMGPLRFSYAMPINERPGDRIQKLQFQIGTSF